MFCNRCGKLLNDDGVCDVCESKVYNSLDVKKNKMSNNINKILTIVFSLGILIFISNLSILGLEIIYNVTKNNDTVKVPYAKQNIYPSKYNKITSDMISYMEIPIKYKIYLPYHYYSNIDDIVGRCINYTTIIPEGSLFMTNMIIDCEDAKYNSYDELYNDYYGNED